MTQTALLALFLFCVAVHAIPRSYDGYKLVKVNLDESNHDDVVRFTHDNKYDVWTHHPIIGQPMHIFVSPENIAKFESFLNERQISFEVLVNNMEEVFEEERRSQAATKRYSPKAGISFDRYYSYDEINAYLEELANNYPKLVTVEKFGSTYEKRELSIIKISQDPSAKNPIIFIDAGIHAREWIAPALALYIIHQLVENSTNADMLAKVDWYVVPSLNPDGYEYSQSDDRMWRKTRSKTVDPDCIGVDPNRNFGFHWNEVGASDYPCDEDYAGDKAFSEIEAASFRDYVLKLKGQVQLYLTLHSYGEYFLYPWGYTTDLPDDYKTLDSLARKANAAQVKAGGNSYTVGSSTCALYPAAGGSDDWSKGVGGVALSYTIELPGGIYGFDLPPSKIKNTVTTFFPAIQVYGQYIKDNFGNL